MGQRLVDRDGFQLLPRVLAKRSPAGRQDDPLQVVPPARLQRLEHRAVFAVHRQDRRAPLGRRAHHQRPGHDQRFLVRQSQRLAGLHRRPSARPTRHCPRSRRPPRRPRREPPSAPCPPSPAATACPWATRSNQTAGRFARPSPRPSEDAHAALAPATAGNCGWQTTRSPATGPRMQPQLPACCCRCCRSNRGRRCYAADGSWKKDAPQADDNRHSLVAEQQFIVKNTVVEMSHAAKNVFGRTSSAMSASEVRSPPSRTSGWCKLH